MLWKTDASNANLVSSYALPFTSTPTGGSFVDGGWEVVAFRNSKGPAFGTVALLSNHDKSLVFVDGGTMQEIGVPTLLSGNPIRIAADDVHGNVIVEYADLTDPTHPKSTFAKVAPTPGTVAAVAVPLASTSTLLGVGFQVSPDGNWLYACQRDACDVQPNQ